MRLAKKIDSHKKTKKVKKRIMKSKSKTAIKKATTKKRKTRKQRGGTGKQPTPRRSQRIANRQNGYTKIYNDDMISLDRHASGERFRATFSNGKSEQIIPVSHIENLAYGWDSDNIGFKLLTFDLMRGKKRVDLSRYLLYLEKHLRSVYDKMGKDPDDFMFRIRELKHEDYKQYSYAKNTYDISYELYSDPDRGGESCFRALLHLTRLDIDHEIGIISSHQITDLEQVNKYIDAIVRKLRNYKMY